MTRLIVFQGRYFLRGVSDADRRVSPRLARGAHLLTAGSGEPSGTNNGGAIRPVKVQTPTEATIFNIEPLWTLLMGANHTSHNLLYSWLMGILCHLVL